MRSLIVLGFVALVCATPACKGGNKPPDCKAAAKNYANLLIAQIERDNPEDGERKAKAMSLVPSLKDQMIQTCENGKWDKVVRRCIAEAQRQDDIRKCMPRKADSAGAPDQPTEPDPTRTVDPAPAEPAPSDNPK